MGISLPPEDEEELLSLEEVAEQEESCAGYHSSRYETLEQLPEERSIEEILNEGDSDLGLFHPSERGDAKYYSWLDDCSVYACFIDGKTARCISVGRREYLEYSRDKTGLVYEDDDMPKANEEDED